MATRDNESSLELSHRRLLAAAGVGGRALLAASIIGIGEGETAPASPSPERRGQGVGRRARSTAMPVIGVPQQPRAE